MTKNHKIIYADNHATTPIDPRVGVVMTKYLYNQDIHGNPSSLDHSHGLNAAVALRRARYKIARFINAESFENIIFTSGATESNNIVLQQYGHKNGPIITTPFEHKSVTACVQALPFSNRYHIPLNNDLTINFEEFTKLIQEKKINLISCIGASNEIGTIMPIHEIGAFCKTHKIPFHCDGTQLAPWKQIDVQSDNIDFLSLSAHKLYGPKGIGILYAKKPEKLIKLLYGGKQEFNKRAGTQNILGIIGFAKAVEIAESDMDADIEKVALIRSKMEKNFCEEFQNIHFEINGGKNRIPNNLSITFHGLQPGLLELVNVWISVSSSSACQAGSVEISSILKWLGHEKGSQTLRIGLGRFTKESDGDEIYRRIIIAAKRLSGSESLEN